MKKQLKVLLLVALVFVMLMALGVMASAAAVEEDASDAYFKVTKSDDTLVGYYNQMGDAFKAIGSGGKVIQLKDAYDQAGFTWNLPSSGKTFYFDGQGHTVYFISAISNSQLDSKNKTGSPALIAFGEVAAESFNLTLKDVNIMALGSALTSIQSGEWMAPCGNGSTLTLDGVTVSHGGKYGVWARYMKNSTINIRNSNLHGTTDVVRVQESSTGTTLNIADSTLYSDNYVINAQSTKAEFALNLSGASVLSGATLIGSGTITAMSVDANEAGECPTFIPGTAVFGSAHASAAEKITISAATFKANAVSKVNPDMGLDYSNATFVISGVAVTLSEGEETVDGPDALYALVEDQIVALGIDLAAWEAEFADVQYDTMHAVTIAGASLTVTGGDWDSTEMRSAMFTVSSGSLTITGGTYTQFRKGFLTVNGGSVELSDVTVNGYNNEVIYLNGEEAKLTVNSGTYNNGYAYNDGGFIFYVNKAATLDIKGGTFNNAATMLITKAGVTTISNATFNATRPAGLSVTSDYYMFRLAGAATLNMNEGVVVNANYSVKSLFVANSGAAGSFLNINGGTYIGGQCWFFCNQAMTTTITNGSFSDPNGDLARPVGAKYNGAFNVTAGTLTISGGSFTVPATNTVNSLFETVDLTITNGEFSAPYMFGQRVANTVAVSGGSFTLTGDAVLLDARSASTDTATATVTFTGGSIAVENIDKATLPTGEGIYSGSFILYINKLYGMDYTYEITEAGEITIESVEFFRNQFLANIDAKIAELKATYYNVDVLDKSETVIPNIVLDHAEAVLNITGGDYTYTGTTAFITVKAGVLNITTTGKFVTEASDFVSAIGGVVNFENATVDAKKVAFYVDSATLNIKSGSVTAASEAIYGDSNAIVNISGGTITNTHDDFLATINYYGANGVLNITGGTIYRSLSNAYVVVMEKDAVGYQISISGDAYLYHEKSLNVFALWGATKDTHATFTMTGGKVEAQGAAPAIAFYRPTDVTILGGEIISTGEHGIYFSEDSSSATGNYTVGSTLVLDVDTSEGATDTDGVTISAYTAFRLNGALESVTISKATLNATVAFSGAGAVKSIVISDMTVDFGEAAEPVLFNLSAVAPTAISVTGGKVIATVLPATADVSVKAMTLEFPVFDVPIVTVIGTYVVTDQAGFDVLITDHYNRANAEALAIFGNVTFKSGALEDYLGTWIPLQVLEGGDLTISFGCTLDGTVPFEVHTGGKLTVSGGTYKTTAGSVVRVEGVSTVVITDGLFVVLTNSDHGVIRVGAAADVTITGGTFTYMEGFDLSATSKNKVGDHTCATSVYVGAAATVNITGGNFYSGDSFATIDVANKDAKVTISGNPVVSGYRALRISAAATVTIKGGSFYGNPGSNSKAFNLTSANAHLVMQGGQLNSNYWGIYAEQNATIEISGADTVVSSVQGAVYSAKKLTFKMSGGYLTSNTPSGWVPMIDVANVAAAAGTTIEISGGKLEAFGAQSYGIMIRANAIGSTIALSGNAEVIAHKQSAIAPHGGNAEKPLTFTMADSAKVISTISYALAFYKPTNVTITGGTLQGARALHFDDAFEYNVNVSGLTVDPTTSYAVYVKNAAATGSFTFGEGNNFVTVDHVFYFNGGNYDITFNGGTYKTTVNNKHIVLVENSAATNGDYIFNDGYFEATVGGVPLNLKPKAARIEIHGGTYKTGAETVSCEVIRMTAMTGCRGVLITGGSFYQRIATSVTSIYSSIISIRGTFATNEETGLPYGVEVTGGDFHTESIGGHTLIGFDPGTNATTPISVTFSGNVKYDGYQLVRQTSGVLDLTINGGIFAFSAPASEGIVYSTATTNIILNGGILVVKSPDMMNTLLPDNTVINNVTILANGNLANVMTGVAMGTAPYAPVVKYAGNTYYAYNKTAATSSVYDPTNTDTVNFLGAAVEIATDLDLKNSGLRFTTILSETTIAAAKAARELGLTVQYGTIIAPADYVAAAGAFTIEALEALGDFATLYVKIPAVNTTRSNIDGDVTSFSGALVSIKEKNYDRAFAAVSYMEIGGKIYYGKFTSTENARSVSQLANTILLSGANGYDTNKIGVLESYAASYVKGGTVDLANCEIVIGTNPAVEVTRAAVAIQQAFLTNYAISLNIVNTSTKASKILVGDALCNNAAATGDDYQIKVSGANLEVVAGSIYGYEAVEKDFAVLLSNIVPGTTLTELNSAINADGNGAGYMADATVNEGDLRIMSHNIWGGGSSAGNTKRAQQLIAMYKEYMPDIIALQEFAPALRAIMVPALSALGYAEVDEGTAGPFYESETQTRTPVFYNTATVTVKSSGYKCLATVNYANYPLLLGGCTAAAVEAVAKADRSKAVTWGIFEMKDSGKQFLAASTHLWYDNSADEGIRYTVNDPHDVARTIQMEVLRQTLVEAVGGADIPVFAAGDYNACSGNHASYATMINGANNPFENLNDKAASGHKQTMATSGMGYPTYDSALGIWVAHKQPSNKVNAAIDHIFASAASANLYKVNHMGALRETYAAASSDHTPIFADISFVEAAAE